MKKFTIIHNFTAVASIEVLAETREEAFEKARQNDIDPSDYEFELDSAEIGHEEDVEDLQHLIEKAEDIIREADNEDKEIKLDPWPTVTTEWWNGNYMEYRHQTITHIFWDYDRNEIGFQTDDSAADYGLSEIPDIEQHNLCTQIINL